MYIIAYRDHLCHLPGLGQVGHFPRETRWVDWGPKWSGSQSTCHPQCLPDTSYTPCQPPEAPHAPYTPASGRPVTLYWGPMWSASQSTCQPQCPLMTLHPCQLPDAPTPPDAPLMSPAPLPVEVLWPCTGSNVVSLQVHLLPQCPLTPLTPPDGPWCPLYPLTSLWFPTPLTSCWSPEPLLPLPPLHPLIPPNPLLVFYCHHFQLTIFMSMSNLQYTICSCQEYVFSSVKLSQLLQYLPKHAFQNSSCFTTLKHQQNWLVFNCCHFATDCLHDYIWLTLYHL